MIPPGDMAEMIGVGGWRVKLRKARGKEMPKWKHIETGRTHKDSGQTLPGERTRSSETSLECRENDRQTGADMMAMC